MTMLTRKTLHERLRESVGELFFKSSTSVRLRELPSNDSRNLRKDSEPQDRAKSHKKSSTHIKDTEPQGARWLKVDQALREKPLPESPLPRADELRLPEDYPTILRYELPAQQSVIEHTSSTGRASELGTSETTMKGHVVLHLDFEVYKALVDVLKAHRAHQRARADADTKQRANVKFINRLKKEIPRVEWDLDNIENFQYMRDRTTNSESRDYTADIAVLRTTLSNLKSALTSAMLDRERALASIRSQGEQLCASQAEVNALFERTFVDANLLQGCEVLPPRRAQRGDVDAAYQALVDCYGITWDEREGGDASFVPAWRASFEAW